MKSGEPYPGRARGYFFFPGRCDRALPAADFESPDVRPSLRTLDAADAAFDEVFSAPRSFCVSALPAADFDDLPVLLEASTRPAALAAPVPVFLVAMASSSLGQWRVLLRINE